MVRRVLVFVVLASSGAAFAHKAHDHGPKKLPASAPSSAPASQEAQSNETARTKIFAALGVSYAGTIAPLLQRSCGDCHGQQPRYPWYYAIPGAKQLIDSDIAEAREHLDISKGFPFESHATPEQDIEAIAKSLREGTMPPRRYAWFHSDVALKSSEKAEVLKWLDDASSRLRSPR